MKVAQPAFAGIATFLRAPQRPLHAMPAYVVAVAGVTLDGSGEPGGPADGPRGIREASVSFLAALLPSMRGTLVDVDTGRRVEFTAEPPLVDIGNLDPLGGPGTPGERLRGDAAELARRAQLPVFLGGTRAISAPLLDGVAGATGQRLALLRVSSTLDLAEPPVTRPLAPEASLRAALELQVPVACLGVHGWQPVVDWTTAERRGVRVVTLADWRRAGFGGTTRAVAEELLGTAERLYVSIDIRVTDGAFVAGRNRVVSDGLLPAELLEVCESLATFPLAAVDVVEVAPLLDGTRRAEHLAFRALLALLLPRLSGKETGG
ncbi:MAG TPA: arginase family protein [Methylomirabilota bacterium]|jgi:arginase family enzyme|nr:arginase family protein [Methylomirabilota bacterium]